MEKMIFKIVRILWLLNLCSGRLIDLKSPAMHEYPGNNEVETTTNGNSGTGFFEDQASTVRIGDARESEIEWSTYSVREPNGIGSFAFGYDNVFDSAGNEHFRSEERFENGTVVGDYGYTDKLNNRIVHVSYIADQRGYRARTQILSL